MPQFCKRFGNNLPAACAAPIRLARLGARWLNRNRPAVNRVRSFWRCYFLFDVTLGALAIAVPLFGTRCA